MIKRFAGTTPALSRAVAHNGIVYAVALAKSKCAPLFEQTKDVLVQIDSKLPEPASNKSRILRATVYITDVSHKLKMDRAWDEWVTVPIHRSESASASPWRTRTWSIFQSPPCND
jgi:enamine deaminase RidA (YjgF/YER057c/UK114 family)